MMDDLPAPVRPTMPTLRPGATQKLTPLSTSAPSPKLLWFTTAAGAAVAPPVALPAGVTGPNALAPSGTTSRVMPSLLAPAAPPAALSTAAAHAVVASVLEAGG